MSESKLLEGAVTGAHLEGRRWLRRQSVRLAWLALGAGTVGGFLVGAVVGGMGYRSIESILGGAAFLFAGARALAAAKLLPGIWRMAISVVSIGGGLGIGFGSGAAANLRGAEQIACWLGAVETRAGLAAVGVAIIIASTLSFASDRT